MDGLQLLRDPNIEPTGDIIAQNLGEANSAYLAFKGGLEKRAIDVDWRYYKDGRAWLGKGLYRWTNTRGTQKETTAFWLSIWEGFFKVTLYIPEKVRGDALALPLSDELKDMIENSKQIGKLKFFPLIFDLNSDELFDEIYTLIDFRKMLK